MKKHVYLCEDSAEGIFSAIYQAWEEKHGHKNNQIQIASSDYNTELFSEYHEVITDFNKAHKVVRTIRRSISSTACEWILNATLSYDASKADSIYRMVILGLHMGGKVIHHLADPDIAKIERLNRNVNNEVLHLNGFLRFEELENGLLIGRVKPKNDIIRLLGDHFANRFPDETFIITDTIRHSFYLHTLNQSKYIRHMDIDLEKEFGSLAKEEELYQSLWKQFVETIAIKPRTNIKLQKQMLPLRFRDYMPEFSSTSASLNSSNTESEDSIPTFSTLRSLR